MEETEFDIKAKAYRLLMEQTRQELAQTEQTINDLMGQRSLLMERIRSMQLTITLSNAIDKTQKEVKK